MPHTHSILLALLLLLLLVVVLMVVACMRSAAAAAHASCCCTAHVLHHLTSSLILLQDLIQQPHRLTNRRLRPIAAHSQLRPAEHAWQAASRQWSPCTALRVSGRPPACRTLP